MTLTTPDKRPLSRMVVRVRVAENMPLIGESADRGNSASWVLLLGPTMQFEMLNVHMASKATPHMRPEGLRKRISNSAREKKECGYLRVSSRESGRCRRWAQSGLSLRGGKGGGTDDVITKVPCIYE